MEIKGSILIDCSFFVKKRMSVVYCFLSLFYIEIDILVCFQTNSRLITVNYTKSESNFLQSCVAIGSLAASIPFSVAFQHLPHKPVFIVAGIISGGLFSLIYSHFFRFF